MANFRFIKIFELKKFISSTNFAFFSFHITLLLLNGLIMEAYSTLKKNCFGDKQLLQHFFKGIVEDFQKY